MKKLNYNIDVKNVNEQIGFTEKEYRVLLSLALDAVAAFPKTKNRGKTIREVEKILSKTDYPQIVAAEAIILLWLVLQKTVGQSAEKDFMDYYNEVRKKNNK